jgi:hypothetical protein
MKKPGKNELWQATAFLLCICVVVLVLDNSEALELSGGRITGPLVSMSDYGWILFALGFLLTFFYVRVAAVIGFIACLLSFPLYFYFVFPGVFRSVFKGNYSVPLQQAFVWDTLSMIGLLTLAAAAFACGHSFLAGRRKTSLAGRV